MDWSSFLKHHNLVHTMSRRGNCHDTAVVESFSNLLKRERICRRLYLSRDEARQDVFDYIEMFYPPKRKHVRNGMLSPVEFEKQQKISPEGFYETRGHSLSCFRYSGMRTRWICRAYFNLINTARCHAPQSNHQIQGKAALRPFRGHTFGIVGRPFSVTPADKVRVQ